MYPRERQCVRRGTIAQKPFVQNEPNCPQLSIGSGAAALLRPPARSAPKREILHAKYFFEGCAGNGRGCGGMYKLGAEEIETDLDGRKTGGDPVARGGI